MEHVLKMLFYSLEFASVRFSTAETIAKTSMVAVLSDAQLVVDQTLKIALIVYKTPRFRMGYASVMRITPVRTAITT